MKNKTALMLGYLCFSTICLVSVSMVRAELAFKTVFIFWFIISVLLLFYVLKLWVLSEKGMLTALEHRRRLLKVKMHRWILT